MVAATQCDRAMLMKMRMEQAQVKPTGGRMVSLSITDAAVAEFLSLIVTFQLLPHRHEKCRAWKTVTILTSTPGDATDEILIPLRVMVNAST